jgi:hypothetical protein
MTNTRTLIAAALLAAPLAAPIHAAAGPAADVAGTWACRTPGVDHGNTPPILFLGAPQGNTTAIDVDGFSRSVSGLGDMVAEADGWWKVVPAEGASFLVRPEAAGRSGRGAMQVRYGSSAYRCHRVQPPTT